MIIGSYNNGLFLMKWDIHRGIPQAGRHFLLFVVTQSSSLDGGAIREVSTSLPNALYSDELQIFMMHLTTRWEPFHPNPVCTTGKPAMLRGARNSFRRGPGELQSREMAPGTIRRRGPAIRGKQRALLAANAGVPGGLGGGRIRARDQWVRA